MKRLLWLLAIILNVVGLVAILSRAEFKSPGALRVACAVGLDESCVMLGWNYSRGWKVPQDPAKALKIFERACARGGAMSCRSAGDFYNGWPKGMSTFSEADERVKAFREKIADRPRVLHFYSRGCDEGSAQACDSLGGMHHATGDDTKAVEAWKRACRTDPFFGCSAINALADKGNKVAAAAIVSPGSGNLLAGWPAGLRVWFTTLLLSIVTGIAAAVTRPRAGSRVLSPRTLVAIAGASALALVVIMFVIRATAENRGDRMLAFVAAVPALLLVIGTVLLALKGNNAASRVLLLLGGFLSIPAGLFPIMVVHELRATPATSGEEPAPV